MTLVKGSLISGQYDKASAVYKRSIAMQPEILKPFCCWQKYMKEKMIKQMPSDWYQKSLLHIKRPDAKTEIEKRIEDLKNSLIK